jgi:hypothetical protein
MLLAVGVASEYRESGQMGFSGTTGPEPFSWWAMVDDSCFGSR